MRGRPLAAGLAAERDGRIEVARSFLIRPPASQFAVTGIHGLGWEDVRDAPTFSTRSQDLANQKLAILACRIKKLSSL